MEFCLDCWICERTGRTTVFEHGAERAVCSGDADSGQHYTAARIAAFDYTSEPRRTTLHAVIDHWWAPFHDARRDRPGTALTRIPWVRLQVGYHCPHQQGGGTFTIQTNLVRPVAFSCEHCAAPVAGSDEVPRIRRLSYPTP
ncbi:hypothetical protein AB0K00_38720 [Dactylosporangium sp. NPDC049525]|uniref:hypothetical protein n=1 Tax=Dactylosporangium sp. NPDC049525 TaxID=3154730 RepID=UPI0034165026